jgi:L-rhamnonate dehydratase
MRTIRPQPSPSNGDSSVAEARVRIGEVDVIEVTGAIVEAEGLHRQHQVQPLHIYPEHRPMPYADADEPRLVEKRITAYYLRIRTDDGLEGLYGAIDLEAARVALAQLRPLLLGQDGLAIEALWDKMHRANRHSRAGHYMMAISAVDNALWDLRGRYFDTPVYRLLGGPTRAHAEAYASCLGYSVATEAVQRQSLALQAQGFRYQKWFLAYGPGDGADGFRANAELARVLRETLGDSTEIMFDAFNGWDYSYALRWALAVEPYHPSWLEEPFSSDRVAEFAQLSRSTRVPLASGEHFYGRWEVQRFLDAGAIQVVQADPEWCGGVSELTKICALASVHGASVIPHGHNIHAALHVVLSQPPMLCPLVEYLLNWMSHKTHFEKEPHRVENGLIALPRRPGFGIELDDAKIEEQVVLTSL